MKFCIYIVILLLFSGCTTMTLQEYIESNLDSNSSFDYNSSNMKKLDEMPVIGTKKCKRVSCRKR